MGIATLPAAAGGGIKTVQRGLAAAAGSVTISAVNTTKAFVTIYGTESAGAVAASGTVAAMNGNHTAGTFGNITDGNARAGSNWSGNSMAISGGSNTLVSAVVQGYLSNSTTLEVSGACRWEVVEFA
jgi:hypothetical protein